MTGYEKVKALLEEIGVDFKYCDEFKNIGFPNASSDSDYGCGMSFDKNGKFEDVYVME